MFIAEGPGKQENERGVPFYKHAKAAKEYDKLLRRIGLYREDVYVTNTVKCHVPDDKDPSDEQVATCTTWLEEEIKRVNPEIIITLGRVSTDYVTNTKLSMEMAHGIPYLIKDRIVLPAYHPAAGLHQPLLMKHCQDDFKLILPTLRGEIQPRQGLYADEYPDPEYTVYDGEPIQLFQFGGDPHVIAIDTEWAREKPWCLTFSTEPGVSKMVKAGHENNLAFLNWFLHDADNLIVLIHNALYDWPVLQRMGIELSGLNVVDTMVMSYLLQDMPQGLKPLAYRIAGMQMGSYSETVAPATHLHAMKYLAQLVEKAWAFEKPDEEFHYVKGVPKVKQPQSIGTKAYGALRDNHFKGANAYDRWNKIEPEYRELPEAIMGKMQAGELCDIDFDTALWYACRDADATLRIYPYLKSRINEMNLQPILDMDMNTIEMIVDMQRTGITPNLEKVTKLSGYFSDRMKEYERKIIEVGGVKKINPGSHDDVRALLYDHLGLKKGKTTKTGKAKTDAKALGRLMKDHAVVEHVKNWREMQKLKTTYADTIPKFVRPDGAIYPNLRITRIPSGRLAAHDPNLLAIPIRTEDGRKIRECYEPRPGCVFICGDYGQIELRVMAHDAQEPVMLQIFGDGGDIHTMTAMEVFDLPESQIDKYKHRLPCKRVNFGIPYGTQAVGLHETLLSDGADPNEWTVDRCDALIQTWLRRFNKIATLISETHASARRNGYVRDMWGRIRWIPQVYMADQYLVAEGLREAQNHPIQAGASGVIKRAMADLIPVYKQFRSEGIYISPLLQIHDDLMWEVEEGAVELVSPVIKSFMESAVTLSIPTPVDIEICPNNWSKKIALVDYLAEAA